LSYDFTVLTIIDANTRELVYIDRYNGVDYSMQRQRIKAACDRFNVAGVIAEANAMGKPNNDELRRMGLPVRDFTTTNATKADIIESLAAAFEQGNIRILNDATLIAELQAYEVQRLQSGMVRYSAPDSMHDDCVMSLALSWHGATAAQRKRARAKEY
jgi:phage terminase large subunit-like protein